MRRRELFSTSGGNSSGDIRAVDLGLPSGLKWAKVNIGAFSETEYGLYFQWGDTSGYTLSQVQAGEKCWDFTDYKYGSPSGITKYGAIDGLVTLEPSDDAATVIMGGIWRMPTIAEYNELTANTTYEFTTIDGVGGGKFTGPNGNYIFLPAAGIGENCNQINDIGVYANYWTAERNTRSGGLNSEWQGRGFRFDNFDASIIIDAGPRSNGLPIRAVYEPIEYEFVDLGVNVKWAKQNIGALTETDYGLYFEWGDTVGYTVRQLGSGSTQKYFGWMDYKFNSDGNDPLPSDMTKYNPSDGLNTLEPSDDAAAVIIGGGCRMPTIDDFYNMYNNTNREYISDFNGTGVGGFKFTNKSDSTKYIFWPTNGILIDGEWRSEGIWGSWWLSNLNTMTGSNSQLRAYQAYCVREIDALTSVVVRHSGDAIRPVLPK